MVYAYVNSKTKIKDSIRALKDKNEKIITDGSQIANILNNNFGSVFCQEDSNIPICENKANTKCRDPTFEEEMIQIKLRNLNPYKTVGVDKVHPTVLKECSKSMARPLSIIYNRSYADSIIPELWLRANVTPIFKKRDKLDPANYRPVSLTSIACKVMRVLLETR
jgi:hypothetical protein